MKSFDIKTRIYFGDQALERLAEIPYQKVMIVTDPFIAQGELIDLVTDPLKRGNKQFEIFKDVVPDPPIEKISEGVKRCSSTDRMRSSQWAAVLLSTHQSRSASSRSG